MPSKFVEEGRPNFEKLGRAYGELEKKIGAKVEAVTEAERATLRAQLEQERFKDRPEKPGDYQLPEIPGVTPEDLYATPVVAWWSEKAHALGLPQDAFAEGIKVYLDSITPDMAAELASLGENGLARSQAVESFLKANLEPAQLEGIGPALQTAAGIRALEKLVDLGRGRGLPSDGGIGAPASGGEAAEDARVEQFMADGTWFNGATRTPAMEAMHARWIDRKVKADLKG